MSSNMKVRIDSKIRISNTSSDIRSILINDLTIKNPQYSKMKALNLSTWNIPREIKLYELEGGEMVIPRGYLQEVMRHLSTHDFYLEDRRLTVDPVNFNSGIKLRDYQRQAVDKILKHKSGVIVKPCGSGKTTTALEAIAEIGQPALWITHTKDLLNQSKNQAKKLLNLKDNEVGVINAGEFKVGSHITFATVQTLARRDLAEIAGKFGVVVIDECHKVFKNHTSTAQFYSVISQFPARYRIGLTASEYRSDGLISTMFTTIGPKIFEVTQEDLIKSGNVITPTVEFVNTSLTYEKEEDEDMMRFSRLLKEAAHDEERNGIILEKLYEATSNDYCLVLGDSLEHLSLLNESLKRNSSLNTAFINGSTEKKKRQSILEDMKKAKINVLFATYQLAKEGLDIPILNKLYLVTPKRDRVVIQQSVGRIMRICEGKSEARVYDFYDYLIPTCINQAKARVKDVYKVLGCPMIGGPTSRKSASEKQMLLNL
jgi:superfamily II DNA or RNA helicase